MKLAVFLTFAALLVGTQAKIDWSKVTPRNLQVNKTSGFVPGGKPSTRITGGVESVPHSRPWQVGLLLSVTDGTAFCGGSLISPQTVLTAAHCVEFLVGPVEVILGAHKILDIEDTQVIVNSSNVIINPGWNNTTLENDLSLIILEEPVELNENIGTIALPEDDSNTYKDDLAVVSGWGKDKDSTSSLSPVLREVEVPVISNLVCDIFYLGAITDGHICCSGDQKKSTCSGDSGGPLVTDGRQIGIVSFGIAIGCEAGWPSAYTRVSRYLDWINENVV